MLTHYIIPEAKYHISPSSSRVSVRRALLTGKSKYFVALFGPNFREGNSDGDITLPLIDGNALRSVVDYCYIGKVPLDYDNIENILVAASSMEFVGLEIECRDFLEANLTTENSIQSFLLADRFSFHRLKLNSFDRMLNDFENVPPEQLISLGYENFAKLLGSDDIEASEETIFDRLMTCKHTFYTDCKWIKANVMQLLRVKNLSPGVTEISPSILGRFLLFFRSLQFFTERAEPWIRNQGLGFQNVAAGSVAESQPRYSVYNNLCYADFSDSYTESLVLAKIKEEGFRVKFEPDFYLNAGISGIVLFKQKIYLIGFHERGLKHGVSVDMVTKILR